MLAFIIKNKLFKSTMAYTIADALSKGVAFLTLPLVSSYIMPEELGIATNFEVLVSILSLLAGLAVVNALPYFYYERTKHEISVLVSSLISLILALNVFFAVLIMMFTGLLDSLLHLKLAFQIFSVVLVLSQLVSGINMVLFRLEEKPKAFVTFQLAQTMIYVVCLFLFVIHLRMEGAGKIYSLIVSYGVMVLIHFYCLYKRGILTLNISYDEIKTLLRFGIPLLPHSLSFWIKSGLDKVLITAYCGLAANGLYSMAMSFGAVYSIFVTAFNNAFVPYLQKRLNGMTEETEAHEKVRIVKLTYKIFGGFCGLYFIAVLFCWVSIKYLLDIRYSPSFQFIPWIILSLTITSFYSLVIQYPYTVKKTLGLGIITFSGSIVQFLLTFILIRNIGVDGIKYSLVLGALIIAGGVWWYSNKVYPMPWFGLKYLGQE